MGRDGGGGGRRRRSGGRALDRLQTALLVLVLLGAGALLGSFWLEWRKDRLPEAAVDASPRERLLEGRPRVEVLNGAGERGAARRAAEALRSAGFDVVYFGNAPHFDYPATRVLDRSGREGAAHDVASFLGLDSAAFELDPGLYLDATVILGADWRGALDAAAR